MTEPWGDRMHAAQQERALEAMEGILGREEQVVVPVVRTGKR